MSLNVSSVFALFALVYCVGLKIVCFLIVFLVLYQQYFCFHLFKSEWIGIVTVFIMKFAWIFFILLYWIYVCFFCRFKKTWLCLCIVWIRILNKLLSVLKKWWTMKTNSWLCVYIILVVFFWGAGCSNEWKEREEVGIKKIWSIVAGQRINSIFFRFWICYPCSHSLCGIFEVNRRVFFFQRTMGFIVPLDLISWSAASNGKCMNTKWNETHKTTLDWTAAARLK